MNKLILSLTLLLSAQFVFAASDAQDSLIKSCISSYNQSNGFKDYQNKCLDQEAIAQAVKKNPNYKGMTAEQYAKTAFELQKSKSGSISLVKLLKSCEDKTTALLKKKMPEKAKDLPSIQHYFYEAKAEKLGAMLLRVDLIQRGQSWKVAGHNHVLCSQDGECLKRVTCQ